MDYAIYKTTNGKQPRIIHRFTQQACNHHAKLHASSKLHDMFCEAVQYHAGRNYAADTKDEFSYDCQTSANTTDRIRFYIAELK